MKKHGQIKALKLPRIALCMMCAFCIVMVAMTAGCAKREDMEKYADPGQSGAVQENDGEAAEYNRDEIKRIDIAIVETQQGERAFSMTPKDFIKSYNNFYRAEQGEAENSDQYLAPVQDWQSYTAAPTVHMTHETNCYLYSEDETVRSLPVLMIYADGGSSPVQQISVSYDEHSYSPQTYALYEEMCFYTLQVMLPERDREKVTTLRDTVLAAAEESFTTDQSASGSLPAFLYYVENSNGEGGVGVYPYFVVGQSEEVRIIPISPDYLEELKGSGVEIRTVT